MRQFQIFALLACSVLSITACSSNNDGQSYLGSRDDIIVHNRGEVKQAAKTKAAITTEKVKQEVTAIPQTEVAEITEIEVKPTTANPVKTQSVPKMENVAMRSVQAQSEKTTMVATPPSGATGDVPPNARPGECYAKVLIPAITESQSERVQVSEEQEVLNRILPARYEIQTERVLVKEARQYWKAGQGPITRKDDVTGEIMCLVEEPAVYKTLEKRVLIEPEKPEYRTVPAQFETITKTNVIKAESWEWRRILCETNMGANSVQRIQAALKSKGYDIKVDGRMGNETIDALSSYQMKNGLATRGITYETLDHLGVQLIGA